MIINFPSKLFFAHDIYVCLSSGMLKMITIQIGFKFFTLGEHYDQSSSKRVLKFQTSWD